MHRWVTFVLCFAACARVPGSVCFFDEACADGGVPGGGGGGGGGAGGGFGGLGGGEATGGGATGGGATGGGAATGGGGGAARSAVAPRYSAFGVPFDFATLSLEMTRESAPRTFVTDVLALPGISLATTNCTEAFSGALLLPDPNGPPRAILIPSCAEAFVEVDYFFGQTRAFDRLLRVPGSRGRFGGAVLGCDMRGYALPDDSLEVWRFELAPDGGLSRRAFPIFASAPRLRGGVVMGTCDGTNAMRIIAAGRGGLFALDVYEDDIVVTAITTPNTAGEQFVGVARVGDSTAVSSFVQLATQRLALVVDADTLAVQEVSDSTTAGLPGHGIALGLDDSAIAVAPAGRVAVVSGASLEVRTLSFSRRFRWPVNGLDGWVYVAGTSLWAVDTNAATMFDAEVLPLPGGSESGGMLMVPSGMLIIVPGANPDGGVPVLTPATPTAVSDGTFLSPWLNKL